MKRIAWSVYGYFAWEKNRDTTITDALLDQLVTTLGTPAANKRILDAGCGTGYYAAKLFEKGFTVSGIDYATGMISVAKRKYSNARLTFEVMDLSHALPYNSDTFDHAISISSLQAVPDPLFTLNELSRVVKKDGTITIVHFKKPDFHKMDLKNQFRSQLNRITHANALEKILLLIKTFAERTGFSTYWTVDEFKDVLCKAHVTIANITEIESAIIAEVRNGAYDRV